MIPKFGVDYHEWPAQPCLECPNVDQPNYRICIGRAQLQDLHLRTDTKMIEVFAISRPVSSQRGFCLTIPNALIKAQHRVQHVHPTQRIVVHKNHDHSMSLTVLPQAHRHEENSGFAVCKPLMRAALLSPIFMLTPDHIAASLVRWSDWACPFIVRIYFTLSLVRM